MAVSGVLGLRCMEWTYDDTRRLEAHTAIGVVLDPVLNVRVQDFWIPGGEERGFLEKVEGFFSV